MVVSRVDCILFLFLWRRWSRGRGGGGAKEGAAAASSFEVTPSQMGVCSSQGVEPAGRAQITGPHSRSCASLVSGRGPDRSEPPSPAGSGALLV